jgi:hypothetical protein
MAEWSKDHGAAIDHLNLTSISWIMVKLEIGRSPYVERGGHQLGRLGSGMWKDSAFKAVAPACVS